MARITAGELAAEAGLTTGAVTAVIDRLERAGYARRVRDDEDRRRIKVEVTPKLERLAGAALRPDDGGMAGDDEPGHDRAAPADGRLHARGQRGQAAAHRARCGGRSSRGAWPARADLRAARNGGATPSSTRSTRARSRTPTATGSATCAGIAAGSTTSSGSASTRSGSRRSIPRRSPTRATTSPTTPRSTRSTAASPTSTSSSLAPTRAASGCCSIWSRRTPRSSTPGSASTPTGTCGPTAGRRTTGALPWEGRPGAATRAAGAGTCTRSTPSSPISTGATRRRAPRSDR